MHMPCAHGCSESGSAHLQDCTCSDRQVGRRDSRLGRRALIGARFKIVNDRANSIWTAPRAGNLRVHKKPSKRRLDHTWSEGSRLERSFKAGEAFCFLLKRVAEAPVVFDSLLIQWRQSASLLGLTNYANFIIERICHR